MATPTKLIIEALKKHKGLVSPAARQLGMTYQGLHKRINNNKKLKQLRDEAREEMLDLNVKVLTNISERASKKNADIEELKLGVNVAKYLLDRLGKERGFVVQQEVKDVSEIKKQSIIVGDKVFVFGE